MGKGSNGTPKYGSECPNDATTNRVSKERRNSETKMVRANKCAVDSVTEGLIVTTVAGSRRLTIFASEKDSPLALEIMIIRCFRWIFIE